MTTSHYERDLPFSPGRFFLTIILTLGVFLVLIRLIAPDIVFRNSHSPFWKWVVVIVVGNIASALFEGWFHKEMLHKPFPFFKRLHVQHELHHGLTPPKKYPIVEEAQHEASYFPWYAMATFIVVTLPVAIPLQLIAPSWPILSGAGAVVFWAIILYEIIHWVEHLPTEKFWQTLMVHPRYGRMWTRFYRFHHKHHANVKLNLNVGGFMGIPIYDILARRFKWMYS